MDYEIHNTAEPASYESTMPPALKSEELDQFLAQTATQFAAAGWIIRHQGTVYMFGKERIYRPLNETDFCFAAFASAWQRGVRLTAQHCMRLLRETLIRTPETARTPNSEQFTVFLNGVFDNNSGQPLSLSPQDCFATVRVEANYLGPSPQYHPITDAFLNTICGGDPQLVSLHWEFWGYALSSDARAKIIGFLYGASGNNGKSTELALLKNLLTPGSVDSMSMHTLFSDFGKNRLRHMRLNISADEGEVNLKPRDIGDLKSISGHDSITANVKFRDHINFTNTCKIIIASNSNIGMAYTASDPAFARRLLMIPYPVSIPREQQDPFILEKLLTERDAIVTEAFNHFLALKARNYVFTAIQGYEAESEKLFAPVNDTYRAIQEYSANCCDFSDPSEFTYTDELYGTFRALYGEIFKDKAAFSQAFYRANNGKLAQARKHDGHINRRGFQGVKLIGLQKG